MKPLIRKSFRSIGQSVQLSLRGLGVNPAQTKTPGIWGDQGGSGSLCHLGDRTLNNPAIIP
ncbi:hypothetical protein AMR42_05480 [Limnothrix sp. PR1529]|nr:hypothetical protein BCR12_03935 [Limnothrix sp. P13C2]PIB14525.1 hypothetical protein AMR42_05480 [Limnothrix sp. PR1529]